MPYAAKATVQHVFVTDHIELYLTFDHPMLRTRYPLADPPAYEVMPPLSKWLLDCDAVDTDVTDSEWIDEYTLKLTSDTLTAAPSIVTLEYDGPDDDLCLVWNKQVYPWGPIPSIELPAVDSTPIALRYPAHATMFHMESTVLVGGSIATTLLDLQLYRFAAYQSPANDGDSFMQHIFLKAGSYTFDILGVTASSRPIVDWYIDDVLVIDGQDWYTAATVYNALISTPGITIDQNGLHTLKAVVNGKNPSSSGYGLRLTSFWFRL